MSTPIGESAYTSKGGYRTSEGFAFVSNKDGTCTLKSVGRCRDLDIVIPDESPNGDIVTIIGKKAFAGCKKVTSISLPDTITKIGEEAFRDCLSIRSITVPDSVTTIGKGAFSGCSSLEKITLPFVGGEKNATEASESTLFGYIFGNAKYKTKTLVIQRYQNNRKKVAYSLPPSLKEVTICGGEIHSSAFEDCTNLTDIFIGNDVSSIEHRAFRTCTSLERINIPDGVDALADYIFWDCINLANITIPETITHIGDEAFHGCSSLTSITIPKSVIKFGSNIFYKCYNLKTIHYEGDNISRDSFIDVSCLSGTRVEFDGFYSRGLEYTLENKANYTVTGIGTCTDSEIIIPPVYNEKPVVSIGEGAFEDCNKLKKVTLSEGIRSIGTSAFSRCRNLQTIDLPNSVHAIGFCAFLGCESLTSIEIPEGVVSLGSHMFAYCHNLKSITIPPSVQHIGILAFMECKDFRVYITDISKWCTINFEGLPMQGAHSIYLNQKLITHLVLPASVTRISNSAFYSCSSLYSVVVPEGVTSIDSYAFRNCTNLASISLPDSLQRVGHSVFIDCPKLHYTVYDGGQYLGNSTNPFAVLVEMSSDYIKQRTIHENARVIATQAFGNCKSLSTLIVPNNLAGFGYNEFPDLQYNVYENGLYIGNPTNPYLVLIKPANEGITSCRIHDDTKIIFTTFSECTQLKEFEVGEDNKYFKSIHGVLYSKDGTSIIRYAPGNKDAVFSIPQQVTTICSKAFQNSSLRSIQIHNGVIKIEDYAFQDCASLKNIYIPDSVLYMGECPFERCTNLTIHCQADLKPPHWNSMWNFFDERPVVWNYQGQ